MKGGVHCSTLSGQGYNHSTAVLRNSTHVQNHQRSPISVSLQPCNTPETPFKGMA